MDRSGSKGDRRALPSRVRDKRTLKMLRHCKTHPDAGLLPGGCLDKVVLFSTARERFIIRNSEAVCAIQRAEED